MFLQECGRFSGTQLCSPRSRNVPPAVIGVTVNLRPLGRSLKGTGIILVDGAKI